MMNSEIHPDEIPSDPANPGPSSEAQGQDALSAEGQDTSATAAGSLQTRQPNSGEGGQRDRAHVRERILRRFETWLDDVLESDQPIEGIAAEILQQLETDSAACESRQTEAGYDLYSLWSSVTAMAEETRLQGRAFKQLHESLIPMQGLVESVGSVLQQYMTSLQEQDQRLSESTRQVVLKEVLGTLIDVRDRLVRGAETANTWLQQALTPRKLSLTDRLRRKILPPEPQLQKEHEEAVHSLLKGYNLAQEVLDETLTRLGVRPMDSVGQPFDPVSMKAVDMDAQSDAVDGTVLQVYRQGYWWNNAVHRPAEVKVARKKEA